MFLFVALRYPRPVAVSHLPFHLMWDGLSLGSSVAPISVWAQLCLHLPDLDLMES